MWYLLKGFLLANALMKPKAVIKDKDHEDTLHQRKPQNEPLDSLPKTLFSAKVDRRHCVTHHDVPKDNDPNWNEAIEAEENVGEETSKATEDPGEEVAPMNWERWAIDEQDDGVAEDLGNAVVDDHLVHPVLLLLQDDRHSPDVEEDGEDEDGKSKPETEASRDLRKIIMNCAEERKLTFINAYWEDSWYVSWC